MPAWALFVPKNVEIRFIRLEKCNNPCSFAWKYHVNHAIKLGRYNVGREGEVLTIPLYMGFLVEERLADVIIPDIELSLLTI